MNTQRSPTHSAYPPSPLPHPHGQAYISAQLTLGELVVGTVFQDIKCTVDSQASLTLTLTLTLTVTKTSSAP